MSPLSVYVWPAAFLVSLLIGSAMVRAGVIDRPNGRSSHAAPTPRGAGLGVLAGFAAGLSCLSIAAPSAAVSIAGITLCGGLAGALGLADDLWALSERRKFVLLVAISLLCAALAGPVPNLGLSETWSVQLPYWIGLLGSALFVFTVANAVNFMDGSDGMLAACLIPAALALAILSPATGGISDPGHLFSGAISSPAGILAAALAGFACLNAPLGRARGLIFAGDTGSLGAAVLIAGLGLAAAADGPAAPLLVALTLSPILVDVLLTMAARAKAGRRLFSAHRAHAYQLLLKLGWTHREVALAWGGAALWCGGLAVAAGHAPAWGQSVAFLVGISPLIVAHQLIRRRAKAYGIDAYG